MRIAEENRALDVVLRVGCLVLKVASVFVPGAGAFTFVRLALDVFREVWNLFRELQDTGEEEAPAWRTGMLMAT